MMRGIAIGLALLLGWPALALTQSPAAPKPPMAPQMQQPDRQSGAVFDEVQKRLIRDYYDPSGKTKGKGHDKPKGGGGERGKSASLPPGLERQGSLPPGLAKKGQALPSGIAKRDLPAALEQRLARPARGTQRLIAGDDMVLVESTTGIVLDLLEGAARARR